MNLDLRISLESIFGVLGGNLCEQRKKSFIWLWTQFEKHMEVMFLSYSSVLLTRQFGSCIWIPAVDWMLVCRTLLNGITALTKKTPERSLTSSTMWSYSENMATYEPGRLALPDTKSVGTFTFAFLASRTMRNKCLLFVSHLVHGIWFTIQMDYDNA